MARWPRGGPEERLEGGEVGGEARSFLQSWAVRNWWRVVVGRGASSEGAEEGASKRAAGS